MTDRKEYFRQRGQMLAKRGDQPVSNSVPFTPPIEKIAEKVKEAFKPGYEYPVDYILRHAVGPLIAAAKYRDARIDKLITQLTVAIREGQNRVNTHK